MENAMTTEKEIQAEKTERELHKNTQKVLAALKENPFGLSGNQLTTICRLSIKTVRNVIAARTDITESLGVYTLAQETPVAEAQAPKPVAAKPKTQKVCIPAMKLCDDAKASVAVNEIKEAITATPEPECSLPISMPGDMPADPLTVYKSQIETVVTRKSKLKLEQAQLSELLSDIFGLSRVDWFIQDGDLVGVLMSSEVEWAD